MGVSLQIFRVRIGLFNPTVRFKTAKEQTGAEYFKIYWDWKTYLFLVLLVILTFGCLYPVVQVDSSPCRPRTRLPCTSSCDQYTVQLSLSLTSPSSWLTPREWNKKCRAKFGNRSHNGRGIKFLMWNKGSSLLQNKHQEIETLIETYRPHIFGLCEANLKHGVDISLVQHQDYQLHVPRSIDNLAVGTARVVVYTHSSLVVKRRQDLENNTLPVVWLEIGLPRQKKLLVATMYREWQLLHQADQTSKSIPAQLNRWSCLLTMWESALMEGKEVLVMGDMNLDFMKWSNQNMAANDTTLRLKPLVEELFTRIFPHGVSQLVKGGTRVWPGQSDSGLDHVYSNKPEKITEIYLESSGSSDHKILKFTRLAKAISRSVKYVRKRAFKNFNKEEFIAAVREISWFELYMCEDPSQAVELLTNKLGKILDAMAPIRTFQVRTRYAAWLSDETKELLKDRDKAQRTASETGDPDDWRKFLKSQKLGHF